MVWDHVTARRGYDLGCWMRGGWGRRGLGRWSHVLRTIYSNNYIISRHSKSLKLAPSSLHPLTPSSSPSPSPFSPPLYSIYTHISNSDTLPFFSKWEAEDRKKGEKGKKRKSHLLSDAIFSALLTTFDVVVLFSLNYDWNIFSWQTLALFPSPPPPNPFDRENSDDDFVLCFVAI